MTKIKCKQKLTSKLVVRTVTEKKLPNNKSSPSSTTSSPLSSGVPTPQKPDNNNSETNQNLPIIIKSKNNNNTKITSGTTLPQLETSSTNLEDSPELSFDTSVNSQKFSDNEEEESLLQEELEEKQKSIEKEKQRILEQLSKMQEERAQGEQELHQKSIQRNIIQQQLSEFGIDYEDGLKSLMNDSISAGELTNQSTAQKKAKIKEIKEKFDCLKKLKSGHFSENGMSEIDGILDFNTREKFANELSLTLPEKPSIFDEVKQCLSNSKEIVKNLDNRTSERDSFDTQVSFYSSHSSRIRSKKYRKNHKSSFSGSSQTEKLARVRANCDDVTKRMEDLARENDILTSKLEAEAEKSKRLKAKLKTKCKKLEKQKQHHLKHGKGGKAGNCCIHDGSLHLGKDKSELESFSKNRIFNVITNEGNEYQNVNWSIMHQSSTIQLMLKRLGLGFMDSRYVTLVLPGLNGKTLDNLMKWVELRKRDMEEATERYEERLEKKREQINFDNLSMTAGELIDFEDEEVEEMNADSSEIETDLSSSIEYIRKLPEKEFLEFISAAKYLNIHDLRDFCIEFEDRSWSNATKDLKMIEQNFSCLDFQ